MHRYSALSACALAIFMLPALAWGGDTVLVLMPETEDSQLTRAGLEEELGHELRVHVAWVGPESSADSVAAALEQTRLPIEEDEEREEVAEQAERFDAEQAR